MDDNVNKLSMSDVKEIRIKIIPQAKQRYATYGDYWIDYTGTLQVRVSDFENPDHVLRIAVHEVVEAMRCLRDNVSFNSIDKFDLEHLDSEDPGCLPEAPYHAQHMDSLELEGLMCEQDNEGWVTYYETLPIGWDKCYSEDL